MHAFALGYGAAFATCLIASMVFLRATARPDPTDWWREGPWIALAGLCVGVFGWVLVWGSLSQWKEMDFRSRFRAVDPDGRWSFAAGFLSALLGLGVAVLAHHLLQPSGQERDLNTIRAGIISFVSVALAYLPGAFVFLAVFRPRRAVHSERKTS